jgi:hypothetical protein
VEVLRAIHLLLAFPLFVVVVAVDARWMKRSLRDKFSLMLNDQPAPGKKPNDEAASAPKTAVQNFSPMATPDDYLEKIFQVPFWIRPMSRTACKNLVNALTEDDPADSTDAATNPGNQPPAPPVTAPGTPGNPVPGEVPASMVNPRSGGPPPVAGGTPAGGTPPKPATLPATFGWSAVEPKPRSLQLSQDERVYMGELAPLIGRSPRSVKRFVNCYRLLKSALDKDELARVARDGTFRSTMLLLGLVTGLPDIAPEILADLRKTDQDQSPVAWVRRVGKNWGLERREYWADLLAVVTRLHGTTKVSTVRPLAEAAKLVDRFSFSPVRTPVVAEK